MRQSNKYGSVTNDEIHLGFGVSPWVSITCLLRDTSHIYWFHPPKQFLKEPPNWISHKSTKVDRIRLRRAWKMSDQTSELYALQHIKIQGQIMPMTGFISGVVTPKDKTKSNPLARLKVTIFSKLVRSF